MSASSSTALERLAIPDGLTPGSALCPASPQAKQQTRGLTRSTKPRISSSRQRLAHQCALVDRDIDRLGEMAVFGDDVADFEGNLGGPATCKSCERLPVRPPPPFSEEPSQSTPHSKGTSDHSDFAGSHTQEHYAPFLEKDIADEITVTVENFLLWIMGGKRGEEEKLQAILGHPKFATQMANYLPRPARETELYHPFVTLANCISSIPMASENRSKAGPEEAPFYWRELLSFSEFKIDGAGEEGVHIQGEHGTEAEALKPDVVLQDQPTGGDRNASKDPQPDSSSYHSTSESQKSKRAGDALEPPVAAKKRRKAVEPKLQCTSYALELLLNGGLRSHNRVTFLAVLSAFGSLRKPQSELLNPTARKPLPLPINPSSQFWRRMYRDHVLELNGGWKLVLGDIIFRAHGVIGCGTVVVRATVEDCPSSHKLQGKAVVVKWSWVPTSRVREAKIVGDARVCAEKGNPDMLRHLPEIYYVEDFDSLRPEFQAELKPITELRDPGQLAKAFKEIFECYRWLHDDVKTIHRDISVGNLMFKQIGDTVYGVLNDFDLAVQLNDEPRSTSKQRTGTKPYMAIDLLVPNPPLHLYRHDLESFLYILVFLTCQIEGFPPANWKNLAMTDLSSSKTTAITNNGFPPQRAPFEGFRVWKDRIMAIAIRFGKPKLCFSLTIHRLRQPLYVLQTVPPKHVLLIIPYNFFQVVGLQTNHPYLRLTENNSRQSRVRLQALPGTLSLWDLNSEGNKFGKVAALIGIA
ncbi:hypothetical protein C8J57DRAFT_1533121 [Mycena rebaudengoi]|nr:hypothetical protein C8J57DRAFT_1533121 [Mycena rebaudengoi]